MRLQRQPPPPSTFGGWPWVRLGSMVMTLAVLFLVIMRLRDPDVARALGRLFVPERQAAKPGAPASPPAVTPEPKLPPEIPLGPTDEDEEEADAAREEFQAISDGTLGIQVEEMFAYQRVVQWVVNQPVSLMQKRAKTDVTFNDFMLSPEEHRGAMVELNLNARMIRKHVDPELFSFPLYEIWGFTAHSGSWLYDALVVDLPESLKEASRVNLKIRVVGYFFKLQGYLPAKAKPGARPEKAPLLIGRVVWAEPGPPETAAGAWSWAWVVLGAFALLIALWLGLTVLARRPSPRGISTQTRRPGAMSMEEWLEHAEAGDAPDEEQREESPERMSNGRAEHGDGNGGGTGRTLGRGLDGTPPRADN